MESTAEVNLVKHYRCITNALQLGQYNTQEEHREKHCVWVCMNGLRGHAFLYRGTLVYSNT